MFNKVIKLVLGISICCSFINSVYAEETTTDEDGNIITKYDDTDVDDSLPTKEDDIDYDMDIDGENVDVFVDDPSSKKDSTDFYEEKSIGGDGIDTLSVNGLLNSNSLVHQSRFDNTTKRFGIDVSEYQGVIDWNAAKSAGVEFAFIRVGYRGYWYGTFKEDKYFKQNLASAKAAGLKVGLYFVTKAITITEAQEEAQYVINELGGTSIDLPIFFDVEYVYDNEYPDRLLTANLSKDVQTDIANTFVSTLKAYGYSAGVYASYYFFLDHMNLESVQNNGYIWMASYTNNTSWSGNMNFWQYSGTAKVINVDGISGPVDADVWYDDGTVFNQENQIKLMYRLYNPNSGEHFYTSNLSEKNSLVTYEWKDEGIGWSAPSTSDYPVYRLYNKNAGEHHFTMNSNERDALVQAGWTYEGIGWYSANPNSDNVETIKREYNPNKFSNNHNYTKDDNEHNYLVGLGWRDEGVGWYAIG